MLRNSLITSLKMFVTWSAKVIGLTSARRGTGGAACDMSRLLLAEEEERQSQVHEPDRQNRDGVRPEGGDAERLGEHPDRDRLIPGGRERQSDDFRPAGERRHRRENAGEIDRRYDREDGRRKNGRDLGGHEGGNRG